MARSTTKSKTTTQTTRIKGARVVLKTTTNAAGETKVTVKAAPVLEIEMQTEAVRQIRKLPGYTASLDKLVDGGFTLAADQNGSGYRSKAAAVKFKAAGMTAGEPDVRLYFGGGVLRALEFKAKDGPFTDSQKKRFPLLRALGFQIEVVESDSKEDAASQAVAIVKGWLAEQRAAA